MNRQPPRPLQARQQVESVLTLSLSSSVLAALSAHAAALHSSGKRLRLVVAESRPLFEGVELARRAAAFPVRNVATTPLGREGGVGRRPAPWGPAEDGIRMFFFFLLLLFATAKRRRGAASRGLRSRSSRMLRWASGPAGRTRYSSGPTA